MATINKISRQIVIIPIKIYRWTISPLLGNHCRFHPSCSQYAVTAIEKHGIIRGCFLTLKRLLCCHPWHSGGIDPVPKNVKERE